MLALEAIKTKKNDISSRERLKIIRITINGFA